MGKDFKARDVDRDLAIDFVEAAWVDGQLTHDEYDVRVDRLLRARTLGELERDLSDLQGPNGARWDPEAGGVPVSRRARDHVTTVPVGSSPPRSASTVGVWVAAVAAVAVLGGGFVALAGNGTESLDATPIISVSSDSPQSAPGYRALVSALDRETGSTSAFELVITEDSARVLVPTEPTGVEAEQREWNGSEWSEPTPNASADERFNLEMISPDVVEDAYIQASLALVGDVEVELRLGIVQVEGVRSCLQATSRTSDGERVTESYDCQGNPIDEGSDE